MDEHGNLSGDWLWLDFNGDRRISVEDVSGWLAYLLFLPGDTAIDLMMTVPVLASFLDLGPDSYGSVASKTASIVFWIAAFLACGAVYSKLRDLDRALTARISSGSRAGMRMLRVQKRLILSWIGMHLQRRRQRREKVAVAALELPKLEAAVLSCYASLEEERMLAATDIAAILRVSMRSAQKALLTLVEHRLVQPAAGTDEVRPAYQITQAGHVYLLER